MGRKINLMSEESKTKFWEAQYTGAGQTCLMHLILQYLDAISMDWEAKINESKKEL